MSMVPQVIGDVTRHGGLTRIDKPPYSLRDVRVILPIIISLRAVTTKTSLDAGHRHENRRDATDTHMRPDVMPHRRYMTAQKRC